MTAEDTQHKSIDMYNKSIEMYNTNTKIETTDHAINEKDIPVITEAVFKNSYLHKL